MDLNAQKEQFSQAYEQAVAAVCGYAWYRPSVDDDSVDLTLANSGGGGTVRSPKLDLQLKCHASDIPSEPHFSYPVKRKNYDDLRDATVLVPRILVVLLVPTKVIDWLGHSEAELVMRRSGYWVSLRGQAATTNTSTVSIPIPRSQPFEPTQLDGIMQRIGSGGGP